MLRKLIVLMAVGVLGAATIGAAAALGPITGESIAAGNAPVLACDTDGVSVSYDTQVQDNAPPTHFEVIRVNVSNLDGACNGKYVLVSIQSGGSHIRMGGSGLNNCTGLTESGGGAITGGAATVDFNGCGIPVEDIDGLSILVKSTPS